MNVSVFRDTWARVMFWEFSNLRTFKTSRVTINHEMHEQVDTIFYLLYSQQNYSNALLCTRYVLHKTFQWFPICSHVLFETIRNIMLWRNINFLKDFEKIQKVSRKLNFQLFKGDKSSQICFQFFNLNRPQWFTGFGELHCPWTTLNVTWQLWKLFTVKAWPLVFTASCTVLMITAVA